MAALPGRSGAEWAEARRWVESGPAAGDPVSQPLAEDQRRGERNSMKLGAEPDGRAGASLGSCRSK